LLEDGAGNRGLILAVDHVGMPARFVEPVCQQIMEKTGLRREQILLNCSHTHAAPQLTNDPGAVNPEKDPAAGAVAQYTQWLARELVAVAGEAASNPRPAVLSWGVGVSPFTMNRRQFVSEHNVVLGINPRGPVDRSVPVLRVDDPQTHKPFAILFGTACHANCLQGDNYRVCNDFPGFARVELEKQFPGATALFMQGFAGDAVPYPRGTMELTRQHGHELAQEVARVLGQSRNLTAISGSLRTALDHASVPLQKVTREEVERIVREGPNYLQIAARPMAARLARGGSLPESYSAPVAVWQIGDGLTLVALPGEPVYDYVQIVEKAIGHVGLWLAGYSNDVAGYIPSARVLAEGGYENRGLYNGTGWFTPTTQDVLAAKVRELAEQVGRPLP
jgi:hypothetical protein